MKAKKTIEVFSPHETRATPPNISFFLNDKRDTGDTGETGDTRDTSDKGHTRQGTHGTQQDTGNTRDTGDTRDTGHTRHKGHREHNGPQRTQGAQGTQGTQGTQRTQGTQGDTGQPRPQGAFPSPTGPKNGKKKQGSIGPCFTLCIFTFCLHLCLAKDNERLWHYHRIWKRFLCG